jgi:hypothetical protein
MVMKNKIVKTFEELTENLNMSVVSNSYIMGKNPLGKNCEYYGEEYCFYVYNKNEDWYIEISRVLESTKRTLKKGSDITLHENIKALGYNWKYVLDNDGFDKNKILTQSEFLSYLKDAFI